MIYLIIHATDYGTFSVNPKVTPFKNADDADAMCDILNKTKTNEKEFWTVVAIPENKDLEVVSNG